MGLVEIDPSPTSVSRQVLPATGRSNIWVTTLRCESWTLGVSVDTASGRFGFHPFTGPFPTRRPGHEVSSSRGRRGDGWETTANGVPVMDEDPATPSSGESREAETGGGPWTGPSVVAVHTLVVVSDHSEGRRNTSTPEGWAPSFSPVSPKDPFTGTKECRHVMGSLGVCKCTRVCESMYGCLSVHMCTCVHVYVLVRVRIRLWVRVCTYVYMCTYESVCTFVPITFVYIHM